jgi:putative ABC transport system permease protein
VPRGAATVHADDLIVMDVYCAQVAFHRGLRFDRIDIVAQPDVDVAQLSRRIAQALDGTSTVETVGQRSGEVERLLGGFQLGLSLASTIALFVGAFIVYNSLAISVPNVEFVQAFRMVRQTLGGEPFYLMSEDFEGYRRFNELAVVEGDVGSAMLALEAGTGIAASEAFVSKLRLGMGDDVTLQSPHGPIKFRIVLVYSDYRADTGILFTTRDTYKRIWRDPLVDLYSVYLKTGTAAGPVRAQIVAKWAERDGLLALANEEYRRELVALIDRSMALARATEFVAVFVAILGIINTLLVGVFDRRRELGVLKAIGAARRQLTNMVLTESLLIAATAALLGVLLGTGLSAYMVIEALRLQVGWRIAFQLSAWVIGEAFVIALAVAWLAAWLPMRWAARLEVIKALQYD